MPSITINQSTFERLQRYARPLLDPADVVVNRALDALEIERHNSSSGCDSGVEVWRIDLRKLPNVKFARVLDASLGRGRISNPCWYRLVNLVLVSASKKVSDIAELRVICPVELVPGKTDDNVYRYLADIDLSVQRLSANQAFKALVTAAATVGIEFEIMIQWPDRNEAAHPGKTVRLSFSPAEHCCAARPQNWFRTRTVHRTIAVGAFTWLIRSLRRLRQMLCLL